MAFAGSKQLSAEKRNPPRPTPRARPVPRVIGPDVHKKTISYCVKDVSGRVHQEGKLGATRYELDIWMRTLPQPWTVAMEATIFTGWIYDHLHPHATAVKVAHPLMLRAIAAAKKKNDRVDASKIADCLRCDFLPECHMLRLRFGTDGERCATAVSWCGRWCRRKIGFQVC